MQKYDNLRKIREQINQGQKQTRQEYAKGLLEDIISTRLKTSFIFAIAEFERVFGYLWGQDVQDKSKLTESQLQFLPLFKALRKSVLDNGNDQIREMDEDLEEFMVDLIQKTIVMKSLKDGQNE